MWLQCVSCNNPVDDYRDSKSFQWTDDFQDVDECRLFLSKYKYKHHVGTVFNECKLCLRLKWTKIQKISMDFLNLYVCIRFKNLTSIYYFRGNEADQRNKNE